MNRFAFSPLPRNAWQVVPGLDGQDQPCLLTLQDMSPLLLCGPHELLETHMLWSLLLQLLLRHDRAHLQIAFVRQHTPTFQVFGHHPLVVPLDVFITTRHRTNGQP